MRLCNIVIATLAVFALPTISNLIEKYRLMGAAEQVYSMVTFARNEAVKRSKPIFFTFSANGTTSWTYGITDRPGGCDPGIIGPETANSCSIDYDNNPATSDRTLYRLTSSGYPGVSLLAPHFGVGQTAPCSTGLSENETCFDPQRAVARNGSLQFSTAHYIVKVVISTLGRARLCTPSGPQAVPDFPKC
jgi:type IV fimbrial biogenesis protein FimT